MAETAADSTQHQGQPDRHMLQPAPFRRFTAQRTGKIGGSVEKRTGHIGHAETRSSDGLHRSILRAHGCGKQQHRLDQQCTLAPQHADQQQDRHHACHHIKTARTTV